MLTDSSVFLLTAVLSLVLFDHFRLARKLARTQVAPTKTLEASQIVIRDSEGRPRLVLGVADDGTAGLSVQDRRANVRGYLGVAADGTPFLNLNDGAGSTKVSLRTAGDGSAGMVIRDSAGRGRFSCSVAGDGRPGLDLFDAEGRPRVTVVVGLDGEPNLKLKDAEGRERATLMLAANGWPCLCLYDDKHIKDIKSFEDFGRSTSLTVPGAEPLHNPTKERAEAFLVELAESSPSDILENAISGELLRRHAAGLSFTEAGKVVWQAPQVLPVGFGYVMNQMQTGLLVNERVSPLIASIYESI